MHVSSTARRYGRALARVAIEKKKEKTVRAELDGILAFLDGAGPASVTLESRAASVKSKERVIGRIAQALEAAGKPLTSYTLEFLHALAENKRFHLFREIVLAYGQEIDRRHGIVEVEVTSAQPLTEPQERDLVGALKRGVTGGLEVRLMKKHDESLLAGFVARIGSTVYDGSLVHQLDDIKQKLISE